MAQNNQIKIAVIGLGAQGLVAVKNLLEEGFNVTGFEKNDFVGGIWHYSTENRVSVLPTTVVNGSKERACFTDFPYSDACDSYPTSKEVDQYLNDYCDHFKLRPHLRLGTTIQSVKHDDLQDRWMLAVKGNGTTESTDLSYDKVVVAISIHSIPYEPELPGRNKFKGDIIHSINFKDQLKFKNKRVLVVGASNTAADTCTSLVGIASEVYFSHRNGCMVVPRYLKNGTALDHGISYRLAGVLQTFESYFPDLKDWFLDFTIKKITADEFGHLDPDWRILPAPSIQHQVPTVSDNLIPALRAGTITSTAAPRCITNDYEVELQDGTTVEVDTIVFCTGYKSDFSILGKYDPTIAHDGSQEYYTPRMYQNILSLDWPDSLALIGTAIVFQPAFLTTDLSTMALAQLWSTKPTSPHMPSAKEMQEWHLEHAKWITSLRASHHAGKTVKFSLSDTHWMNWVQETAGVNVQQNLDWTSLRAWQFWWNDRKFCNLLTDGVLTTLAFRLFESDRRKKWDGAREAIVKMNESVKRDNQRRKGKVFAKSAEKSEVV